MGASSAGAIALANHQQGLASDPDVSAFVSASAGSGKTKLLIDRLLRLMLPRPHPDDPDRRLSPGTDPSRILCLTYTKAAAAEMAIRLQRELGRWVTLDDTALGQRLTDLGCVGGASLLVPARALFARVLDLPGGMRIGTIHAFCQSLLRRFPVEAEISPHFRLIEDTDSRIALSRAWEAVLADLPPDGAAAVDTLAGQIKAADAVQLLVDLQAQAPSLRQTIDVLAHEPERVGERLRRIAGVVHATEEECLAAAVVLPDEAVLAAALRQVIAAGSDAVRRKAGEMAVWLAQAPDERARHWAVWRTLFLTAANEPRAASTFVNPKLATANPNLAATLVAEAERVAAVEDACRAIAMVALTMALLRLAGPVLGRYAQTKRVQGLMDYDDLIERTLALLRAPGSAWVLYKLDGGIDHVLLDEVQDTSDLQWRIAHALTDAFFDGEGLPRTLFAVGDTKQSIYSFQGADPEKFHLWNRTFRERVELGRRAWREPELTVSFRSTVPVLALVDQVFAGEDAAFGVIDSGRSGPVRHVSARPDAPGRVELWPLVPTDEAVAANAWAVPTHNTGQMAAPQRLASQLARWIAAEIAGTELAAGDILVLVPRRSAFVRALIRALKSEKVPVATLVSTSLKDQIAVQDLMALCDALLLPADDLTLGCVLTSPLGGLSDDSLMALAAPARTGSLWEHLRHHAAERPDWQAAWTMLSGLFARVDYVSPHGLLSEALGRFGGRARLLARLGPEAAEPVDELLAAAQRHAASHPPSLQGFLHWLRRSNEMIKRQPDAAGDAVRVMTVHGAKGLQARLVVLPDTTGAAVDRDRLLWDRDEPTDELRVPLWVPRAALASVPSRRLHQRVRDASRAESNRLLYVALTRAADRLLICGWERRKPSSEPNWYALCSFGFQAAGATPQPFDDGRAIGWDGERLVLETAPAQAISTPEPGQSAALAALPAWAGAAPHWQSLPPPPEPALPRPLAPSRPDDVGFGPVPALRSPLDAGSTGADPFRRGRLVHAALQYLPGLPVPDRGAALLRFLAAGADGLDPDAATEVAAMLDRVLAHPQLEPLFAPGALVEQPISGVVDAVVITGRIDRLAVLPDRVLLCDFKTDRRTPARPELVPVAYLRQMAAYRALLAGLYPDRAITCALVWTQEASVMTLDAALLAPHSPASWARPTPVT